MNKFNSIEEMAEYDAWYLEQYERNSLNTQSTYQKEINKILKNRNKDFLRAAQDANFRNKILQTIDKLRGKS